ncbi:MAG TPA: carboxylesterase family protein, partial [Terricaulis sp.]|nr:carboxylesterase family protein [Terricaulis sp.]
GDLADEFLRLYPGTEMQEDIYAATRDGIHGWAAERLARAQTALGAPAYLYFFDHSYPAADAAGLRAFHAIELPYIFGALDAFPANWPPVPNAPEETRLSEAMIGYWTSFAANGVPRAASAPDWPVYADGRGYMLFADAPQASARLHPGAFELIETLTCRSRHAGEAWTWRHGLAATRAADSHPVCESAEN